MNVLLVTTWGTACGIAEHSRYLKAAVEAADPSITVSPDSDALDPARLRLDEVDLLHLNYHAALHSRWTPRLIRLVQSQTCPVVVTYHDTGVPNSEQAKGIHAVADLMVVHEPAADLPGAVFLRQGIPAATDGGWQYPFPRHQPILGSVGFPFPWKNFDLLARATALAGWALVLLAPQATPEQVEGWRRLNPASVVIPEFVPAESVVRYLAGCDATAFLYTCANTGTSGAIRQGIAARKPVIAATSCRQFRDLRGDTLGASVIRWIDPTVDGLVTALSRVPIQRVDAGMVALATRDSWAGVGAVYATLYQQVREARAGGPAPAA